MSDARQVSAGIWHECFRRLLQAECDGVVHDPSGLEAVVAAPHSEQCTRITQDVVLLDS
jgi:hypothetical protein